VVRLGPYAPLVPSRTRREPRYPVALPTIVTVGQATLEGLTADVSFEGAFLEIPSTESASIAAVKLGQLAKLTLLLPEAPSKLETTGTVVHIVRHMRRVGVGLRFYGMGREAQARWDRFIGELRDDFPMMSGRAVRAARAEHFEPVLYRSAHHVAVVRVYVRSVVDLYTMTEAPHESTFILTDEPLRAGDELGVQLVHPDSEDIFELSAFVTRVVNQHGVRGLEIEFLNLDAERKLRLRDFADDGLEALFDEEVLAEDSTRGD
jgi:hypothetical protein